MLVKRPIKNVHIYVLKDPETGEVRYVGKTKTSLKQRLYNHLGDKSTHHRSCWIKSLKNRNLKPVIESIELVSDETWAEREIYWIQYYKDLGAKLVNSNDGGKGGHNPSAETRAKLSVVQRNMSAETRAKIGAARLGKKHTAESIAKMSAAKTGKKRSAETKAKIGAAHKGKKISAESRARIGAAHKGKKISAESRAKSSAKLKIIAQARYKERAYSFLKKEQ